MRKAGLRSPEVLDELESHLRDEIANERLLRVSAQRGLVAYIERSPCPNCGKRLIELGVRVGYDPDKDPKVQQEIIEGKILPRGDVLVMKEIATAIIAERLT